MIELAVRGFLMDMDGTLADSIPALRLAYMNFLDHFGSMGTLEEFDRLNGPSLREIIAELKSAHGLRGERQELSRIYIEKINEVYPGMARPNDGAVELLEYVKSRKWETALVTSANGQIARMFLENHKLGKYFDAVITAGDVKRTKPNPEIYIKALNTLDLSPQEAVAVEDSISGVLSATASDINTIALDANGTLDIQNVPHILCRQPDLPNVLRYLKEQLL